VPKTLFTQTITAP